MVERDGCRIAFEIQLASQTDADFLRRQRRYEADGIECLWLVNTANWRSAARVPSFILRGDTETFTLDLLEPSGIRSPIPVDAAIAQILNDDVRPGPELYEDRQPRSSPLRKFGSVEFDARWQALRGTCQQGWDTREVGERDWKTPYPAAEMSTADLAAKLKQVFLLLELNLISNLSASRRRDGIYDNFPELLGEFYPGGNV